MDKLKLGLTHTVSLITSERFKSFFSSEKNFKCNIFPPHRAASVCCYCRKTLKTPNATTALLSLPTRLIKSIDITYIWIFLHLSI